MGQNELAGLDADAGLDRQTTGLVADGRMRFDAWHPWARLSWRDWIPVA